jgi:uroporphyrinogen decarboxylase
MPQFAPLKNDTFLRALLRQPTDYTPVWLMRQAGRYLPEYRATRARAGSFLGLAKNPDYATEVTLQPIDRYALDASILFSDILTVPDAMGLGLYFEDGEGPKFERTVRTEEEVAALRVPDMASLDYVFKAVTQIRTALDGRILDINAEAVAQYLNAQIDAGAQAVMIFDSWGGALADGAYQAFSLAYMKKVVSLLKREKDGVRIPAIAFTKGGGLWLDELADIGADALGVDWTVNLGRARALVGDRVALQGNLDPAILFAAPEQVRTEVEKALASYGTPSAGHGHVFNLGHGISQFTPPESVTAMVEAVHDFSRRQRAA